MKVFGHAACRRGKSAAPPGGGYNAAMTIPLSCPCGQRLRAPDDQAGRQMRCPACRQLLRVPGEPDDAGGYAVEQVLKCKGCRREWPVGTVVCVECGYNFETGRKLRTKVQVPDRVIEVGSGWAGTYTRYRVYRDGRGKPRLGVSRKLLFVPLGETTYDLSAYRAVLTDYSGDDDEGGTYYLELEAPGRRPEAIFAEANEEAMRELVELIARAGGLEIKRK